MWRIDIHYRDWMNRETTQVEYARWRWLAKLRGMLVGHLGFFSRKGLLGPRFVPPAQVQWIELWRPRPRKAPAKKPTTILDGEKLTV